MNPPPSHRATLFRLVAYTAVLFAGWNHNLLGVPTGFLWYRAEPRAVYHGFDSFLVVNRLRLAAEGAPLLYPMVYEFAEDGAPVPYRSQFGGQGIAAAAVQQATGLPPVAAARVFSAAAGLLAAAVFASVFAAAGRRFGPVAGDVACALAAPAPALLQLAPSPYWVLGLVVAPFALVWAFGRAAVVSPRGWRLTLGAVGLMAFAKSLCGYEFITTMLAAPVAALWFHQHRHGVPFVRRCRAAAVLVGVGVVGFGLAVGCHALQLRYVLGDDPVATIRARAVARTVSTPHDNIHWASDRAPAFVPDPLRVPVNCFLEYFHQPAVSTPLNWGRRHREVPLSWLVLAAGVAALAAGCRPGGRDLRALTGAAGLALLAGASWQVLATNHMCNHLHISLVVYHLAFVPLALVLVGCGADAAAGRLRVRCLVPWGLVALFAGTVGYTAVTTARDAEADAVADRAAVDAVTPLAAAGAKPVCPRVACCVHTFSGRRQVHPNTLVEAGWVPESTADAREPLLLLTGWATDLPPGRPFRAPRLVVAVAGKVVPAWVARCGQPHLDRQVGWKSPTASFLIVLPRRVAPDPATVQVYAVASGEASHVTAARMPDFQP